MLENSTVIGSYYPEPELPQDEDAAYELVRQREIDENAQRKREEQANGQHTS
jgi:hypothetical protein